MSNYDYVLNKDTLFRVDEFGRSQAICYNYRETRDYVLREEVARKGIELIKEGLKNG